MDIAHPLTSEVSSLSFSFLSSDDIRSISVKRVDNPVLLDNLNMPTRGGLYDPKLGPMSKGDICETCRLSYFDCPGHYGHIDLPVPVYHPLFMNQCYQLLRGVCLYCHHFKMPEVMLKRYAARLKLLDAGLLEEAHAVAHIVPKSGPSKEDGEATEDAAEDNVPAESAAEFILRLETYVKQVLKQRKKRHERDAYKDGLVYAERRRVLNEFGKKIFHRCAQCQAYGNTFRKEKSVKIVEFDLTPKQKLANNVLGLKRQSVSFGGSGRDLAKKKKSKKSKDAMDVDEGIEASSSSSASSDDEMEVDEVEEEEEDEDVSEDMVDEGLVMDGVARTASGQVKGKRGRNERVMAASEVRSHLRMLFHVESEICTLLYGRHGGPSAGSGHATPAPIADMFFMDVVPVTPTRFRPASMMGEELFENSQNTLLTALLNTCHLITNTNQTLRDFDRKDPSDELLEKLKAYDKTRTYQLLLELLVKLQHDVNSFIDSTKNPTVMKQGKLPPQGIKQLLEKKEGLFRKHMMGKRVNYAARSVISPDINIETNEIGLPPVFAKKLTYPEPVTPQNVHEMRQLVINGPKVHPGATIVQNEDGSQVSLDRLTPEQRLAVANQLLTPQNDTYAAGSSSGVPARNKKVFRHIRDGDIVILNRQPTLHKPSMMCHRVRVLQGEKTIRMHYANCNSYNADFDGDEMNIHFPQNEIARAEAQMIANTDNQYLVPTSGNPLRGLIQDHVVAGVWMCNKSSFFTRDEYYQLIYGALRTEDNYSGQGRIRTLPPAIFKPRPMWTGKQIISTILLNLTPPNARGLTLTSKNKISNALWGRDDSSDKDMSEEQVIFRDGHLLVGILDKSQYGASAYGLVHSVHELYGPYTANRLLAVLSRLLTKYLQHTAFTCRMDDLILTAEGEKARRDILEAAKDDGTLATMKFVGLPADAKIDDPATQANLHMRLGEILHDNNMMGALDTVTQQAASAVTSKINKDVLPRKLVRPFPDNNMQNMTLSGAKGSGVNASSISTLLGQQALEGRRVPVMVSGKTLPAFKAFDTSARAGGFVANRFLTGIRPQEYYFHCLSEDHQVLTDRGFLFGGEIESRLAAGEQLTFASYSPDGETLSYEKATHFVRREHDPAREPMVSITHAAERGRWNGDFGLDEDRSSSVSGQSNGVSMLVTGDHDMFVQFKSDGRAVRENGVVVPPAKVKANELLKANQSFKMWGYAKNGIALPGAATATDTLAALYSRLELATEKQQMAFHRLMGYWLGDGTLMGKASPAIVFSPRKHVDWVFLREIVAELALVQDVDCREYVRKKDDRMTLFVVKPSWVAEFFGEYGAKYDPPTTGPAVAKAAAATVPSGADVLLKSAKWMPSWTSVMSKRELRALIEGLRMADGNQSLGAQASPLVAKEGNRPRRSAQANLDFGSGTGLYTDEEPATPLAAVPVTSPEAHSEAHDDKGQNGLIYAPSVLFRDQVVVALLHAGYSTFFTRQHPNTYVNTTGGAEVYATVDSWAVHYTDLESTAVPTMHSPDVVKEAYTGSVWCVTVPPHGLIVTRRARCSNAGDVVYASRPMVVGNCMAGREGLIDTAVKTARSGYLQRCLIKHLEGVKVHYDHTVRDSDSSVLQFLYGDDAIDVTKSRHLTKFDFAAENHDSMVQKYNPAEIHGKVDADEAIDWTKKALKKPAKYEPAMSIYSPSRYLGSMSEAYARDVNEYISKNPNGFIQPRKGAAPPSATSSVRIPEREFAQLARVRYMRSLIEPGEAVGLLASQGVGEPSTQMTLNTFHLAGHGAANVTLGIPRLREIVMTAAKKPMTPTMTLPLREEVAVEQADRFVKQVTRLTLSAVVEKVTVTEKLSGKSAEANNSRVRRYTVLLQFYPPEEYEEEYEIDKQQLHEALCTSFADKIKYHVVNQLRTALKAKEQDKAVGQGLKLRAGADLEDGAEGAGSARRGGDDELDDDDEDSGQLKRQRQAKDLEYEADEEGTAAADLEDVIERDAEMGSDEDDEGDEDAAAKALGDRAADTLAEQFKKASKFATSFHFDPQGKSAEFNLEFPGQAPKLLLVDLIEEACRDAVIHEVPSIGRCLKNFDKTGEFNRTMTTEGSNLRGMWALADELIDLDRISSNDVYAILQTYGVEAARRTIINEMSAIFGSYGIAVDYRHLTVIADYMTHGGGYTPFNRTGIAAKSSPLLKASFETTVAFLSDATLHGDYDDLTSPAAKIVMGQPSSSGTGSFDVRAPKSITAS